MNQLWRDSVRPIRPDEWPRVKELRLLALQDPAAPLAFLETYERAVAEPDAFWRERAEGAADGTRVLQFVAEGPGGVWGGTATAVVEDAGSSDVFGVTVQQRQAHIVGVFVRREHRGSGAADALFEAAVEWAVSVAEVARVRLYVHEDNARAERFYRRFGFVRSGVTAPVKDDPSKTEVEMVLDRPETPSGPS